MFTISCGETDPQATVAARSAVSACEEVTRENMVSSSSYKTLWSDYTEREPLSAKEVREIYNANRCAPKGERECLQDLERFTDAYTENWRKDLMAQLKAGKKLSDDDRHMAQMFGLVERPQDNSPAGKTGFVLLEYESENAFGASLRGFDICRFGPIGDDGKFDSQNVIRSGPIPLEEGVQAKAQYEQMKVRDK